MNHIPPERGAYQLLEYIDSYLPGPATLVELGARDCNETSVFSRYLPGTQIFAFECNPATLPLCRQVAKTLPNVTLIEKAVADKDGAIDFFAIDPEKTKTTWEDGNPGASSLLQASGKYPIEEYVQKKVRVKATRLDTFLKQNDLAQIDVLWMDIQGAELMALKSLGQALNSVGMIFMEVEFLEIYKKQPLFDDIFSFLHGRGFILKSLINASDFSADAIFLNAGRISSRLQKFTLSRHEKRLVDDAMRKIHAHKKA